MTKYLIDTNILIEHFKGNRTVTTFLTENTNIWVSYVTLGEFYQGILNKTELNYIDDVFELFNCHYGNTIISKYALELLRQYKLSHGLHLFDALIASTAINIDVTLVTLDTKHFKAIPKLKLYSINNK